MGKAVMCFIRKPEEYLIAPAESPLVNTHVSTLMEDLRALVENRALVRENGIRGRAYIERYFTLQAFADRLKKAYETHGITP